MEPSSLHSSVFVDIEKGRPLSPSSFDGSTISQPNSPAPQKPTASVTRGLAVVGVFAGIKRFFDHNPSAIIRGRYTINFRQILILIMIMMSVTLLWFIATHSADDIKMDRIQQQQESTGIRQDNNRLFVPPQFIPSPEDTPSARERFERVRGKGSRTSLKTIQFKFLAESEEDRAEREMRLKAVRDGFAHAWNGYKEHAWGHDEVLPVSGGYKDNFNGWGATMIDSLDTLVIMGFNKEFDEVLDWIKTSFDMTKNPTDQLQFFETIIRYLGGLLSAYDLTGERHLLDRAEELGNYMLNAFQDRIMPASRVAIQKSANSGAYTFLLADVGSIQLEFTRLSTLTKNPIYNQKAQKIIQVLGTATSPLPGLLPYLVQDGMDRQYDRFTATVGGMADSYYEYLLKEWILLDGKSPQYKDMFETAADSMAQYMVLRPDNGSQDYVVLGQVDSSTKAVVADMEHLACFMAGSFAIGAKYFNRPKDMTLAKQVAEGCYLSYHHSTTGLGPEAMKFNLGSKTKTFVANPDTYYSRTISRTQYILRPETLESLWILYRLTGEKKYQDKAWEIFQSLEKSCRTPIAYSGLKDVNTPNSHDNKMESFFMAETMKYLYLIFSTPDVISLDDFVLNTEAHPLRRT
ncbi:hypothetical protein BGZ51_002069 [Haplosporangium sp. Z 767]|nr:hypothetical protein BGZ51_002069 [Haplosporangium sp. Z 767]